MIMEPKKPVKFTKYLLVFQILVAIGIGICEVMQVGKINKSEKPIVDHPEDWDYLIGYTSNHLTVVVKIYYWIVLLVSIGVLGRSLKLFEKRWKNFQYYDDRLKNVTLLVLWCIATIPSVILLFSKGLRTCSSSTSVPTKLLTHCHAYIVSLFLAYTLIITFIIQLLYDFIILQHQKKNINIIPSNIQEPKKMKIQRSRHVAKKKKSRSGSRSSLAFTDNSTRLSVVTEDEEDKDSHKSSIKSNKSYTILQIGNNRISNETGEVRRSVTFNV